VDAQRDDPESTLELYRRALRSRREVTASLAESVMLLESAPGALSSDAGTNSSASSTAAATRPRFPARRAR